MDAADRELLQTTVREALAAHVDARAGEMADDVLAELGWLEMLEAEPRDATGIVFTALGATNGYASVLDDVFAAALGVTPRADLAVVLPPYPTVECPARGERGAAGMGTARAASAAELLIVRDTGREIDAVVVPAASAAVTTVHGIAPRWAPAASRSTRSPARPSRFRPPPGRPRSRPGDGP